LLAAGGTGGHLFPAQALAAELGRRGMTVDLATDERADKYGEAFPARATHIISSATFSGRSPVALLRAGAKLLKGIFESYRLLGRLKPDVVVGFGGYPTFPPLIAASLRRIPTVLHEQNVVAGRANRVLGRLASAVAASFPEIRHGERFADKIVHTGNPVRPAVIEAAARPYEAPRADGSFHLLVFGGSQGARFFSESLPAALALVPQELRARIDLVQQCRAEDIDEVVGKYEAMGLRHDCAPFFTDLPARIAAAHLVICRSGASTVTELAVIGRPSIMVPFPYALDHDQAENARTLAEAGGGTVIRQDDLTPERLAAEIATRAAEPDRLAETAAAARGVGRPDAVSRLADLVLAVASGKSVTMISSGENQ